MIRGKKAAKAKSAPGKKNRPKVAPARAVARPAPRPAGGVAKSAPVRPGATAAARSPRADRTAALGVDPALFEALSEGERADALRILTEDRRLANMAKVSRYRVVAAEPLVLKPPHELFGHRLARVIAFDYAADRCVDALIDLDEAIVAHLELTQAHPALAREEESLAVAVALQDDRVKRELGLGDEPQAALQYWSRREADQAYGRRSAVVLFGQAGTRPSLVAVVDLVDRHVIEVVPAEQW
jgi:hypothetical protein